MTQLDVPPDIADLFDGLRPTCTAKRWGKYCDHPAVAEIEIHNVHHCNDPGLTADGGRIELVCADHLAMARGETIVYTQKQTFLGAKFGGQPCCSTCCRPTGDVDSIFQIRPIGPA
jgi:hypothetical protein